MEEQKTDSPQFALLSCPFCGYSDAKVDIVGDWAEVQCRTCGARSPLCGNEETAARTWNSRARVTNHPVGDNTGLIVEIEPVNENPFDSVSAAIAFSAMDWAAKHVDAWVYGITIGWGESITEVAEKHRWDQETVDRLSRLHNQYQSMRSK